MSRNICVKISDEVYETLKELVKTYGSQKNVIEQSVLKFKGNSDYDNLDKNAIYKMHFLTELKMALVNKKELLHLIEGDKDKIIRECAGIMELQSLSDKTIKSATIDELVELLQLLFIKIKVWFDNIYKKTSILGSDVDLIVFMHSHNKDYSQFMSDYIIKIYDWLGYEVLNKSIEDTYFTTTIKKYQMKYPIKNSIKTADSQSTSN